MGVNYKRIGIGVSSLGQMIMRDQESKRQHDLKLLQIERDRQNRAATVGLDPTANWDEIGTRTAELVREKQDFNTLQMQKYKDDLQRAKEITVSQSQIQDFLGDIDQSEDTLFRGEIPQALKEAGLGEQMNILQRAGQFKQIEQQGAHLDLAKTDYTADSWKEYQIKIQGGMDEAKASESLRKDPIKTRAVRLHDKNTQKEKYAGIYLDYLKSKTKTKGIPTDLDISEDLAQDTNVIIQDMRKLTGNQNFGFADLMGAIEMGRAKNFFQKVDPSSGLTLHETKQTGIVFTNVKAELDRKFGPRPVEERTIRLEAEKLFDEALANVDIPDDVKSRMKATGISEIIDNHNQTIANASQIRKQGAQNLAEGVPNMMKSLQVMGDEYDIESFSQIGAQIQDVVEDGGIFGTDKVSDLYSFGIGEGAPDPDTSTKYFNVKKALDTTAEALKQALKKESLSKQAQADLSFYGRDLFEYAALDVWKGSVEHAIVSNNPKQQEAYQAYKNLKAELSLMGVKGSQFVTLLEAMGKSRQGLGTKSFNIPWLRNKEQEGTGTTVNFRTLDN
jgi:hypothetical protein